MDQLIPAQDTSRKRLSAISDTNDLTLLDDSTIVTEMSQPIVRQRSVSRDDFNTVVAKTEDKKYKLSDVKTDSRSVTVNNVESQPCCVKFSTDAKMETDSNTTAAKPESKSHKLSRGRPLNRTKSEIERMTILRIPRDSSFRRLTRQLSRRTEHDVPFDDVDGGSNRPRSFFDLAIITMCCCVSPLGLVAVIVAVLSDANHKAGHDRKAVLYSRLALGLSSAGIISSIALAITLLLVFRYPWDDVVQP